VFATRSIDYNYPARNPEVNEETCGDESLLFRVAAAEGDRVGVCFFVGRNRAEMPIYG
jgi:hypothetical protein